MLKKDFYFSAQIAIGSVMRAKSVVKTMSKHNKMPNCSKALKYH